jgi:hypothetical protein
MEEDEEEEEDMKRRYLQSKRVACFFPDGTPFTNYQTGLTTYLKRTALDIFFRYVFFFGQRASFWRQNA